MLIKIALLDSKCVCFIHQCTTLLVKNINSLVDCFITVMKQSTNLNKNAKLIRRPFWRTEALHQQPTHLPLTHTSSISKVVHWYNKIHASSPGLAEMFQKPYWIQHPINCFKTPLLWQSDNFDWVGSMYWLLNALKVKICILLLCSSMKSN